jgi:antitoxin component YwqK of YwqJK toxin-antitoxin module
MKHIFILLFIFFVLHGCGHNEIKKTTSKYRSGKPEIICIYQNNYDTLTYRKESFYESGKLKYLGFIRNGKKENVWTWFYENGNLKDRCKYLNGNEIDTISHWYNNGILKQFDVLKKGKIMPGSTCTVCCNLTTLRYFENGNPKETFTWIDNIQQDTAKSWFKNGQLQIISVWKNGVQNGIFKEYYSNGQIKVEAYFNNSDNEGKATEWDSLGKVTNVTIYPSKNANSK